MGASCNCEGRKDNIIIQTLPAPVQQCADMTMAGSNKDTKGMINHRLLVAARDNDIGGLRDALEQGAYLETRRPFVMRPRPPSVVSAAFDANGKKKKKKGSDAAKEGLTPLMYAAQNGSPGTLRLLLEAKAHTMARDEEKVTPLHFAALSGELEVVRLLMAFGAERDAEDDEERRPIDYVPETCLFTRKEREQWENMLGERSSSAARVALPVEGGA